MMIRTPFIAAPGIHAAVATASVGASRNLAAGARRSVVAPSAL